MKPFLPSPALQKCFPPARERPFAKSQKKTKKSIADPS